MSNVNKTLARNAISGLDLAYSQAKLALEQINAFLATPQSYDASSHAAERTLERINSAMAEIDFARAEARGLLAALTRLS